jgi:hypothetical protein
MKINSKGIIASSTHNNYSLIQKLAIVNRAWMYGKNPTARVLSVSVSLIHRWTKQHQQLLKLSNKHRVNNVVRKWLHGGGRPPLITKEVKDANGSTSFKMKKCKKSQ